MFKIIQNFIFVLVGCACIFTYGYRTGSSDSVFGIGHIETSNVSETVEKLKTVGDLVSMESLNVVTPTSTYEKYGMTAEITEIVPGKIEYKTSLRNVKYDFDGKVLKVHLPETRIEDPIIDSGKIRTYDNGSFLLFNDKVRDSLESSNLEQAKKFFRENAKMNLDSSRKSAIYTVYSLIRNSLGKSNISVIVN